VTPSINRMPLFGESVGVNVVFKNWDRHIQGCDNRKPGIRQYRHVIGCLANSNDRTCRDIAGLTQPCVVKAANDYSACTDIRCFAHQFKQGRNTGGPVRRPLDDHQTQHDRAPETAPYIAHRQHQRARHRTAM
jgi:hypothetical protein